MHASNAPCRQGWGNQKGKVLLRISRENKVKYVEELGNAPHEMTEVDWIVRLPDTQKNDKIQVILRSKFPKYVFKPRSRGEAKMSVDTLLTCLISYVS